MSGTGSEALRARLDHPGLLPAVILGEPLSGARPPRRSLRDWIVDVVAFVWSLGIGAVILGFSQDSVPQSEHVVFYDLLLGSVCCLALWWRRRWPVQIGLLTAVLSAFSAFGAAASVIALFTVALHRRLRALALVTLANAIASVAMELMRPDPTSPMWVGLVIGALIMSATIAWGLFTRARRQVVLSLRERAERAEAEQQLRVTQARQLERTRIAREMHDVLAHRISLISLHAGALEFSADATRDDVAASAAVIRQGAHEALEDLREILGVLRTENATPAADAGAGVERPQPTLIDLPALVEQSRTAGMQLTLLSSVPDDAAVPTSLARTAFRVVQEGLTNAHKHAPHTAVTIRLAGRPGDGLDVEVRNRGSVPVLSDRMAEIPGSGQGLVGLAERTSLIGGRLEHGVVPGGDFRLHAWLPWPA